MKDALAATVIALLFLVIAVDKCDAQDNYITCRYIPTGVIQTFPGMQCPNNWHPL